MSASVRNQFALWWQFTRRELESRHRGSHLGVLWMLLTPLLEFAIYATIFGVIFGGRYGVVKGETQATYALGVFLSLTLYRLAAETLASAPGVILAQPNLVKKVVFPLHLLPLAALGGIAFRGSVSLMLWTGAYFVFGPGLAPSALWMPLLLLPLAAMCVGGGWLLASLGVFLRDIGQLAGPASMVMLYSSAIFYSAEMVARKSEFAWSILRFNPLLHIVEGARRAMLWHETPSLPGLAYAWVVGALVLAAGWFSFRKLRSGFADVL